MNCCLNENVLSVIQGDTLDVTLTIENPEALEINRVIFTVPSLQIQKDLTPLNVDNDDLWGLVIPAKETAQLRVGRWSYSITAISDNSKVYTVLFKNVMNVMYNRSKNIGPVPPYVIKGIGWTED